MNSSIIMSAKCEEFGEVRRSTNYEVFGEV